MRRHGDRPAETNRATGPGCSAETARPADAILIRPDAYVAWAAASGEPSGTDAPALREALSSWFGTAGSGAA